MDRCGPTPVSYTHLIKKMEQEVEYRRLQLRPQLLEDVKTAREFGDLSENFEYKAAKRDVYKRQAEKRPYGCR